VRDAETEEKDRLAAQQLALFWGGEPKYVITALKFMQFGYAVAISTVISFFEEINDGPVRMEWYLIVIFMCYALFVHVTGHAIPRFVLCTSLGQLVDERRLREVVALFRLDEAKQKQLDLLETQNYEQGVYVQESFDLQPKRSEDTEPTLGVTDDILQTPKTSRAPPENRPPLVAIAKPRADDDVRYAQPPPIPTVHEGVPGVNGEFTTQDEKREVDDPFAAFNTSRPRRNRRKVVSEGVAAMASLGESPALMEDRLGVSGLMQDGYDERRTDASDLMLLGASADRNAEEMAARRRERRSRRKKSASDGVALMAQLHEAEAGTEFSGNRIEKPFAFHRSSLIQNQGRVVSVPKHAPREKKKKVDEGDLLAELVKLDTNALRTTLQESERVPSFPREPATTTKRTRRKVVSDGVAAMAAMGSNMSSAAGKVLKATTSPKSRTHDDLDIHWKAQSSERTPNISQQDSSSPNELAARRRNRRKKSVSDGVAFMSSLGIGDFRDHFEPFRSIEGVSSIGENRETDLGLAKQTSLEGFAEVDRGEADVSNLQSDSKIVASPDGEEDLDGASIHSTTSTVGAYSDVDDVPATTPSISTKYIQEHSPRPSFRSQLRAYFLSKRYVTMSNVFGTVVVFFLVGHRVEGFIHSEAIIPKYFVSLYVPLETVFWFLTAWFSMFLISSCLIFYSVGRTHETERNVKEKEILVAAALDVVLTTACLTGKQIAMPCVMMFCGFFVCCSLLQSSFYC